MLNYPLMLRFKRLAISPRVTVTDSTGQVVAYVRQKAFRLREDVRIYTDQTQQDLLYQLRAGSILDYSTTYSITDPAGRIVGAVGRKGARSIWRASFDITDPHGNPVGHISEENPWTKVLDTLVFETVPFVGDVLSIFSGYVFNPAYLVDLHGQTVLYVRKRPAFGEGRFTIEKRGELSDQEEELLLPSIIMAVIRERERG